MEWVRTTRDNVRSLRWWADRIVESLLVAAALAVLGALFAVIKDAALMVVILLFTAAGLLVLAALVRKDRLAAQPESSRQSRMVRVTADPDGAATATSTLTEPATSPAPEAAHVTKLARTLDEINETMAAKGFPNPNLVSGRLGRDHPVPFELRRMMDLFAFRIDKLVGDLPSTTPGFVEWRDKAGAITHEADVIAGRMIDIDPDWASLLHDYRSEPIVDVGVVFSSEHAGWKRELLQLGTRVRRVRRSMGD